MQKCVCFSNPCINLPVSRFVTREPHLKVLMNFTCCNVMPCIHCLGFLGRHNTLVFLVLIFILLTRTKQKTCQVHVEDPVEKMLAAPNRRQKANG